MRWVGHVIRLADISCRRTATGRIPQDVKRAPGLPLTFWWHFFVKAPNERYVARCVPGFTEVLYATGEVAGFEQLVDQPEER